MLFLAIHAILSNMSSSSANKVLYSSTAMILLAISAIIFVPQISLACLWDRDTLASEASGLSEVPHILTGWFPRNPPLYYEMRLKQTLKEIEANPEKLSLYDDAAVAADRLGHSNEAIHLMEQKHEKLIEQDANKEKLSDQWYRYFANKGTFIAHQWFSEGKNKDDISNLRKSKEFIEKAIEINPDAHFGREKYQLLLIDWLIKNINSEQEVSIEIPDNEVEDALRGFTGLIALGGAWESVDVVNAIGSLAGMLDHSSITHVARKRSEELKKSGKLPLFSSRTPINSFGMWMLDAKQKQEIDTWYQKSRREAEEWHQQRTEYMLSRLNSGQHPDLDDGFWNDLKEVEATPLYGSGVIARTTSFVENREIISFIGLLLIFMLAARLMVLFSRRKLS